MKYLRPRYIIGVVIAIVLVTGTTAAVRTLRTGATQETPTVRVQRGDVDLRIYTVGELRPVRTAALLAPPVNGTLQIVHLWSATTPVKAGDVVVGFDTTEQEFKLEQSRFDLQDADENIAKSNADAAVQAAQDKVALLTAKFDVRRAELDVSRNELLSAIDARKNVLALEEAKRRLAQLQQDTQSRETSSRAALAVLQEKRKKALLDMEQAQHTISTLRLTTTIPGAVAVQENRDASGGNFFPGMVLPEYREGDVVRPGRTIANVLDGQMEVTARISERDRSKIAAGQAVGIRVDALPGVDFSGKVKTVAGLASMGMWWMGDTNRAFDTTFQVDREDGRLKPGQTVQVVIAGEPLKGVLFVPAQALFEKNGKQVLYVRNGSTFEPREVKIKQRTEARVVVEGVAEGAEVALVDPDRQTSLPGKPPAAPAMGGGAR
jgi:HlyD family secretion protein